MPAKVVRRSPKSASASISSIPIEPSLERRDGELVCEGVALERLARQFGTPLYVYSLGRILANFDRLNEAFRAAKPLIAYSVKANSNLAILSALARRGAGFDIVSGGELARVERIGADPRKVIFAGVGKSRDEIRQALKFGVGEFNIESPGEAERIEEEAHALGVTAHVALRLNPDVDPHTHQYISTGLKENKFGINMEFAGEMVRGIQQLPHLKLVGLHAHIGSQIMDPTVHARAVGRLEEFVLALMGQGVELQTLNIGGGYGIDYQGGASPLPIERVAEQVIPVVRRLGLTLVLEPGRCIVGNAGVLLTRVLYVKRGAAKTFVIVDASMAELLRPALYAAYHRIVPVKERPIAAGQRCPVVDVVGPVCESGDFLARERELPPVEPGDLLAILDAGAYGMVMASNYNTRGMASEVLVHGKHTYEIRRRQETSDLISLDAVPEALAFKPSKASSKGIKTTCKKPGKRQSKA